jgi:DNA-binding GntR family transcriptional regulator
MKSMSLKTPLKSKTLQQTVHDAVRDAILIGELKPGEPVSLKQIAEQLGVSTMPVRESLRQLEAQGLVTFASQRKILITQLTLEDLKEFYWIRVPLEVRAFLRNFDSLDQNSIKELRSLQQKMSKKGIGEPEWNKINREFHMILYGADKSPVLKDVLSWLWMNVAPYLAIFARSSAVIDANRAHLQIIELIEKKDKRAAEKVLQKHLESGVLVVASVLQPQQTSDDPGSSKQSIGDEADAPPEKAETRKRAKNSL